jgi:mRNA deadenylase 3'-5' endonuclease subunit Ccr4
VPGAFLEWQHRRAAIVTELALRRPDVVSLQEVDRFAELEAELQQLG